MLAALLEWLEAHGTVNNLLDIRYLGVLEGHGVFAKRALVRGQVTMQVPFKLTMNIESAAQSDLAAVLETYPQVPDDEVLALHLMHERSKGSASFFAPYIASLPATFDLPVFWSDAELNELKGTNVLLLTQLMKKRLERDFENIHKAVTRDFPDIFASLPMLTQEDYTWAMSVIWSRAFGVSKGEKYLRVLCPTMDMFNHDVTAGSALRISYGQYSNAKLLYSYGFVAQENFRRAVDFWIKIPPTDPYLKLKQTVLDSNELTSEHTYDFCGTLFKNDVDERLLATLRIILMDEQEIRLYKTAFQSSMISARNELAAYKNLHNACYHKLASYTTTVEEDVAILAEMAELEAEANSRLSFAVQVRIEDKQVFTGAMNVLEQWKEALVSNPEQYPPCTTRS